MSFIFKMEDTDSDICDPSKIPTHILVQKQMQDLIAIQKARVARLELDVSCQNDTIREQYVTRDQYETDVSRFQTSLTTDYVPKEQYEMAVSELEEEKIEHVQTKVRLKEVTEKLELAFEEMDNLKQLLEKDRKSHEKMSSTLKSKTMQETSKNMKLQSKCSEITEQCERQEDILQAKNLEIKSLERRLKSQSDLYRKEISEADIEKKQQRYIAQMIEEQERKKSKVSHQAVPKTKSNKR